MERSRGLGLRGQEGPLLKQESSSEIPRNEGIMAEIETSYHEEGPGEAASEGAAQLQQEIPAFRGQCFGPTKNNQEQQLWRGAYLSLEDKLHLAEGEAREVTRIFWGSRKIVNEPLTIEYSVIYTLEI